MQYLRTWWRFLVAVQLLPALEGGEETLVGGQAVLEGVMMRSPHAWAIACRTPSGEVLTHSEPLERLPEEQGKKKLEISGWMAAVNVVFSIGFFIFMYKFLPLLAATELKRINPVFGEQIIFNLVDGIIRIAIFLLFIWGVSLLRDIRRVYEYHGAEHKTVFAFENGDSLETAAVQKYSTYHPRCGTSFLMTVMLISILVYTVVPVTTFWARFAVRIALLPLIAGLSYEIIRFAAKHRGSLFALMTAPGLWLQRITTQPPSDDQAQCAIVALDEAMSLEKQHGGELVIA